MRLSYFFILTLSKVGKCLSFDENYEGNFTIWDAVVVFSDSNQEDIREELREILCSDQWVRFIQSLRIFVKNWPFKKSRILTLTMAGCPYEGLKLNCLKTIKI